MMTYSNPIQWHYSSRSSYGLPKFGFPNIPIHRTALLISHSQQCPRVCIHVIFSSHSRLSFGRLLYITATRIFFGILVSSKLHMPGPSKPHNIYVFQQLWYFIQLVQFMIVSYSPQSVLLPSCLTSICHHTTY